MAQLIVTIDDSDPRDPDARCDRCGKKGTVARAVRHSEPPIVSRFCGACWPEAQRDIQKAREIESEEWHRALRLASMQQTPRPAPPPPFSSTSRSWHDIRRVLQRFMGPDRPRHSIDDMRRAAADIRRRAPEMEGPIPSDIEAFLDEFDPPASG